MFKLRMIAVTAGATLLLTGAVLARAADEPAATQTQAREQERTREQAIESVKKRLKENPRDEGLRHAAECLANSEQCRNVRGLDQALESIRHNMERHPDDKGLRHAMDHLERHHRRLGKEYMERERPMHRDNSGRPEKPERHDGSEGVHR